jgi:suppressor for copper-sensitivity B
MVQTLSSVRKPLTAALVLTGLATAGFPSSSAAVTGPWRENEQSRVRLVSAWAEAPRSGELDLGLEFEIRAGWHVYWKNSGDAGFPPVLDFSPTPEVTGSELLWPAPERYELRGGLVAFGYEDHVIYPLRIHLRDGALAGPPSPSTLALAADLDYLVCEVDCIPYSYRLDLEQPLAAPGAEPVRGPEAEEIERWWGRLPRSLDEGAGPGVTTRGALDLEDPESPRLVVEVDGVTAGGSEGGPEERSPQIFLETHEVFDTGRPSWERTANGLRFTVPLSFREVPEEMPSGTEMAWTVTGLRRAGEGDGQGAGETFAVEARRRVAAVTSAATLRQELTGGPGRLPARAGSAVGRSPWAALVAGLLLTLTPALLALFGLWLGIAGRLARSGIRRRALATGLGTVAGFALAALAAQGLELPTWGAQLQEPVLVTLLALLHLALAFAAWGLLGRLGLDESREPIRPEIPGLASGLLVACFALGWNVPGLAFDPPAAVAAGLGAAAPYLLVAAAPAMAPGFRKLAARFRLQEGLGFLALVGLVWLLYLLTGLLTPEGLTLVELMLLVLALLAWGRSAAERRAVSRLLGLLLLAGAVYVLYLAHLGRVTSHDSRSSVLISDSGTIEALTGRRSHDS